MTAGMIISNNMILSEEESIELNDEEELIAIKVKNVENLGGLKIKKGDIVNIYASAKISELKSISNLSELESFSNESANGYITIKMLRKTKVINCVCSDGNNVDIIVIKVDKNDSLKINNLKNYCEFSIGVVN